VPGVSINETGTLFLGGIGDGRWEPICNVSDVETATDATRYLTRTEIEEQRRHDDRPDTWTWTDGFATIPLTAWGGSGAGYVRDGFRPVSAFDIPLREILREGLGRDRLDSTEEMPPDNGAIDELLADFYVNTERR